MSEILQEIIDRVKSGIPAPTDIQALAAAIQSGQVTLAAGQQAVAIAGNAAESNILTGNNNYVNSGYQGWSVEDIRDILEIFKQSETASLSSISTAVESGHLGKITLEVQDIDFINSKLAVLEEIQQFKQLSKIPTDEFNLLRRKIQAISSSSRELKEIEIIAGKLLEQSVLALTEKIRTLKLKSKHELAEPHLHRDDVNCQTDCLEKQLQLLRKFETNLEYGKQGADWLNLNITDFAKSMGKYALSQCPSVQKAASVDMIDDFYFSIEQLLERISHCLIWGRYSILDSFDIPLIFDQRTHEFAFSFFQETIIPSHLPTEVRKQIHDYVNYLVKRLPLYSC
ncbi:MAG: hypothetical protein KME27_23345 [Lyngbya sp. HA4199-MV5]|jgi:hypothetical protein|nr:hypothetical protein [Stenomitos rutilans HA7619-LM2]MBW4694696.1 hypothetical protein [Lyngbya sp. HA4199-MV5]